MKKKDSLSLKLRYIDKRLNNYYGTSKLVNRTIRLLKELRDERKSK